MTEEKKLELKQKILAFYIKLKADDKGPVYRMVMENVLKEYAEYFEIKLIKN